MIKFVILLVKMFFRFGIVCQISSNAMDQTDADAKTITRHYCYTDWLIDNLFYDWLIIVWLIDYGLTGWLAD